MRVSLSARPASTYGGTRGTMSDVVATRLREERPAIGGDHADAVPAVLELARGGDGHVVVAGEHLRHLPAPDLGRAHALRDRAVDDEEDPLALIHV